MGKYLVQKMHSGNEKVGLNKSQQTLSCSPRSEASLSKLAMSEGNVRSNVAIAASCDNHLTSLASFSLIPGSCSNAWIACSPDIRTGLL